MGLEGSIELGQGMVFDVEVSRNVEPPRYFRQAIYDTYNGEGWSRTGTQYLEQAEASDWGAPPQLTREVSQTITTLMPSTEQLYAAPQPVSFDLPTRAEFAAGGADLLTVSSTEALPKGSRYSLRSNLSQADMQSLRSTESLADPAWVQQRYVALPFDFSPRVRELAAQITHGYDTRIDKATAIERYLHREMSYNEDIPNPPNDMDRVEWFLFEQKEGYCDYYASSFVTMARSLGIPARLAAGYSRGELVEGGPESEDSELVKYRQRSDDAHTWPEVYFPELGWIEFEPTQDNDPIVRAELPQGDLELPDEAEANSERPFDDMRPDDELNEEFGQDELDRMSQADGQNNSGAGADSAIEGLASLPWKGIFGGLIGLFGVFAAGRYMWERPFRGLNVSQSIYARLVRSASLLGIGPKQADTPMEYAERMGGVLPEGHGEISTIVGSYVQDRYGAPQGTSASVEQGSRLPEAWSELKQHLRRASAKLSLAKLRRNTDKADDA